MAQAGVSEVAMMIRLCLVLLLFTTSLSLAGLTPSTKRSDAARHAFAKGVACPATGKFALPCPGYIIDHIMPLCAGGADAPDNMQWQTVSDAKKKDVLEVRACACLKQTS